MLWFNLRIMKEGKDITDKPTRLVKQTSNVDDKKCQLPYHFKLIFLMIKSIVNTFEVKI